MSVADGRLDDGGERWEGGFEVADEGFVGDEGVEGGGGYEDWRRCGGGWVDLNWIGRRRHKRDT